MTDRRVSAPESTHAPIIILSPDGTGIRSTTACLCGEGPKRGAASSRSMFAWHQAHVRKLGLPRADYSAAVHGADYPAAGMTWGEWYAAHGDADPFGEMDQR